MGTEPLILAVDTDPALLRVIQLELATQGFRTASAMAARDVLKLVDELAPDLILLLDIATQDLTDKQMLTLLKEHADIPVIMATTTKSDAEMLHAFALGVDDYLSKPFSLDQLSARIRSVLRRRVEPAAQSNVIQVGEVEVDLDRRVVRKRGEIVMLTRTEWMLLREMAMHQGRAITNESLLVNLWGSEFRSELEYLRVWIWRLRRKLEAEPSNPVLIRTVKGVGYMLASDRNGNSGNEQ